MASPDADVGLPVGNAGAIRVVTEGELHELIVATGAHRADGAPRVVHVKGFGPVMPVAERPPPPGLLAHLRAADVLVFDGDDYEPDSTFTAALAAVLREPGPGRLAVALKLADELDRLQASWAPFLAAHPHVRMAVLPVPRAAVVDRLDLWEPAPPELPAVELRLGQLRPGQDAYVALGLAGVQLTRRYAPHVTVAAWGGHDVVGYEFASGVARLGTACPRWHYWHAARVRDGEVQEGRLVNAVHERLVIEKATLQ